MNLMGYDALGLGAGDLQLGTDVLRTRMEEATFPFLAANVERDGQPFGSAYALRDLDGHTVALIGLTELLPSPIAGFETKDPVEVARSVIDGLPSEVDIIIVLAHVGLDTELQLRDEVPDIDVIVGGSRVFRTATPLWDEETGVLILPSEQPSPGHAGRLLGKATLSFDPSGRLLDHDAQMISLGPDIPDDPAQAALLQEYLETDLKQ